MSAKVIRCMRCQKRLRRDDGWNVLLIAGIEAGYLCPTCQRPEEDLEAAVNEVIEDYSSWRITPFPETGTDEERKTWIEETAEKLARTYRTPEKLRAKADELEAVRRDEAARNYAGLIRAVAGDVENGWRPWLS
jgi:hypothetical protein